jgi:uncharacterized protein (DUF1697 family)
MLTDGARRISRDVTYVAFLRAVNVARTWVAMSDLRGLMAGLGFGSVRTLLQSGNVVFEASRRSIRQLESAIEAGCADRLGLQTTVMVRGAGDLAGIVSANPFPREAARDPGHLVAILLKAAPETAKVRYLSDAIVGRERVALLGNTLYAVYPDGIGRSKLTAALIDRKLATKGTARNWNTILKLAEACRATASHLSK